MSRDLINIDLWCREPGGYRVEVARSLDDVPEGQRDGWRRVRFGMRPLTWKLHTDMVRAATTHRRVRGMGGRGKGTTVDEVDWALYRQEKALRTIASWDITEDGKAVPVRDDTIMAMHPELMEALLDKYDSMVLVTKEREKALILKAFKYYQAVYKGSKSVDAPPEVVELSLMEKFSWTPQQIAEIPYGKIQELFILLNQRDRTQNQLEETRQFIASDQAKKGRKS